MTDRELDALVAEKVMGWKPLNPELGDPADAWYGPTGRIRTRGLSSYDSFSPSTDIAAAWEVVEKLGMPFEVRMDVFDDGIPYRCVVFPPPNADWDGAIVAFGNSAPRAICLAALEVVGVEVEDV